jgi:hypothetical protein
VNGIRPILSPSKSEWRTVMATAPRGASTQFPAGTLFGPCRHSSLHTKTSQRCGFRKCLTCPAKAPRPAAGGRCCRRRELAARAGAAAEASASAGSLYESLQSDSCTAQEALAALTAVPLEALMSAAAGLRDTAHRHITFSPKVFIPLTRLCRDRWAGVAPACASSQPALHGACGPGRPGRSPACCGRAP